MFVEYELLPQQKSENSNVLSRCTRILRHTCEIQHAIQFVRFHVAVKSFFSPFAGIQTDSVADAII